MTPFPLGHVTLAVSVVDVGSKIVAVEVGMEIWLVDLLISAMRAHRAVGARLCPVVGVLLPQALSLSCCNVETSMGLCNLRSLRKTLEYLEHSGHVCRWGGEEFMDDELILEVPRPW